MNKRKLMLVALSLCMVAILAMGSTLAYLTDTDNRINTFTVGKVDIEQNEKDRNGNEFKDQKIYPVVDDEGAGDDGYHHGKNYVDKIVTVTVDEDSEPAYVRTYIAIPADLDDGPETFDAGANILHWNGASANDKKDAYNTGTVGDNDWYWTPSFGDDWPNDTEWNGYQMTIGEGETAIRYNVYVATHKSIVANGATTAPSLMGVYLDRKVNCDANGKYFYIDEDTKERVDINFDLSGDIEVLVATEAVQAKGFDELGRADAAIYALDSAFGYVGDHCPFGGKDLDPYDATEAATDAAKAAKKAQ